MKALIEALANSMIAHFSGTTVGTGGDFGATLTRGPFNVHCYFHQWQEIEYPSIHMQVVAEQFQGPALECCPGGLMALLVDFRISVDQKSHGWSVAAILQEALREWLCEISGEDDLQPTPEATPLGGFYVAYIQVPDTAYLYNGELLDVHLTTRIHYLRQQEGVLI